MVVGVSTVVLIVSFVFPGCVVIVRHHLVVVGFGSGCKTFVCGGWCFDGGIIMFMCPSCIGCVNSIAVVVLRLVSIVFNQWVRRGCCVFAASFLILTTHFVFSLKSYVHC